MKTNRLLLILVFVLLLSGWILFRAFHAGDANLASESGFQAFLWEQRALDLVMQIVLVFAGALGIAAILPAEDQDD